MKIPILKIVPRLFILLAVVLAVAACSAAEIDGAVEEVGLSLPGFGVHVVSRAELVGYAAILIGVNLVLAVISAIRAGVFDWTKLANWHYENVVLQLGSWLVADFLANYVFLQLFAMPSFVDVAVPAAMYAMLIASLIASIAGHARAIGILPQTINNLLELIGIRERIPAGNTSSAIAAQ